MGKQADLEDFERTKKALRMSPPSLSRSQHPFREHNPKMRTAPSRAGVRAKPAIKAHYLLYNTLKCVQIAKGCALHFLVQYAVWCEARRAQSTPPPSFPPVCFLPDLGREEQTGGGQSLYPAFQQNVFTETRAHQSL